MTDDRHDRATTAQALDALAPQLRTCRGTEEARQMLYRAASEAQLRETPPGSLDPTAHIVRDCARALRSMLSERAEGLAGFRMSEALYDVATNHARPDLGPAFFADVGRILEGVLGQVPEPMVLASPDPDAQDGEALACELDGLWSVAQSWMDRYEDGLGAEAVARREARRDRILSFFGATEADWSSWEWQVSHLLTSAKDVARAAVITEREWTGMREAEAHGMPFGLTPYYASLLDDTEVGKRDRAVRAQVLPPPSVAQAWGATMACQGAVAMDFMEEGSTSPVPLVTRRYPAVAVLKPFLACPQVCAYCQRNWEIEGPMAPSARATWEEIETALRWVEQHTAIRELLITGGDPLGLPDSDIERILRRVDTIGHLDVIRIGTRTPVSVPMRITNQIADLLAELRRPGSREVIVVTHIQHPYEVTPELLRAVSRLRARSIAVFNQMVYTFHVSRRFEAARLRMLLRAVGVDPYYTFVPKGKSELDEYRTPLSRLLQERKEEARLLPGTRRTDEAVYNLPRLGKSHIEAAQHRDLIAILPSGARVYEFHPWEKNIRPRAPYIGVDVPILDYLARLHAVGEDPADYETIWYYF